MKYLVTNCWSKFYDEEKKRFNGEMFEKLVEYLLIKQYGAQVWTPTQQTWDGKKDFYREYYLDNEKFYDWAECKMYKESLSINVLTPTLIMSTLKPVNEIIFFSYSSLNENAKDILCEFAATHHKNVKVYDDEKLEELIIQSLEDNALDEFFCDIPSSLSKHTNSIISCKEKIYLPLSGERYTAHTFQKCSVKLFEVLEISAIIENLTSSSQKINCSLDLKSSYHFFEGPEKKMYYEEQRILLPGELITITFPLRIINYIDILHLPSIHIYIDNHYFCDLDSKCKMSWLVNSPFIGRQDSLEALQNSFSRKSFSVLCLYGRSGVGKTRFMKEIQCRYAMSHSNTIFISSQQVNKYCLTWIKKVFSCLYVLPLVEVENLNGNFQMNTDSEIIAALLYNTHFDFNSNYKILARILLHKLSETNTMLFIDNVQDFDNNTIAFLNEVLNYSDINLNKQLILSFNQDFIAPNSSAQQLLERLKLLEKDDSIRNNCIEIKNFKKEHALLYIKHCLQLTYDSQNSILNNEYIINKMLEITKGNPLFLEQIMLGLCQEKVISYNQGICLLNDENKLYSYLCTIPNDINMYLSRRIKSIKNMYSHKWPKIKQALCVLTFFEEISSFLLEDILDEDYIIEILISLGIIKLEDNITFYHPLIFKYFQGAQYVPKKELMKNIYQNIESHCLVNKYPAQYYICYLSCNKGTRTILKAAITELLDNHIPPEYIIRYSDILLARLSTHNKTDLLKEEQLIDYYTSYCYSSVRTNTYSEAIKRYQQIYDEYLQKYSCFLKAGYAYGNFIMNYQNTLLTINDNKKVIQLGEYFLSNINKFSFSNGEQERICATICNRLHVAYNRVEKHLANLPYSQNAFENLSFALKYARNNNDQRRIIQNMIDFGNMYFCANIELELAFDAWKEAEKIYSQSPKILKNLTEQIYFHKAIADTLNTDFEIALNDIENICSDYTRTLPNPFYFIKANLLKTAILIMQQKWNCAEKQLLIVEEICQTYNYSKGYPICAEFHAILEECYFHNTKNACFYYQKAFMLHSHLLCTSVEQEKHASLFLYLASKIKKHGGVLTEEQYYLNIKCYSLREQLNNIFTSLECNTEKVITPFLQTKLQYWCSALNINLPIII